ncbi:MAG: hypothetical protein R3C20_11365 [Planctomycetaceae bacterium]
MTHERKHGIRQSLSDTGHSLRVTLNALYHLSPGIAVIGTLLAAGLVWLTMQWTALMTGTAVLLILALSLAIFAIRGNFGEALLSLVGGLLSVFAYEWTPERYVAFSVAWIGFALFAMLIASVKIASKNEDIFKQAAIRIVGPKASDELLKEIETLLTKLGRQTSAMPMLGPIERAEVIRTFAFRGLPIALFAAGIRATEALSVITKCDTQRVALFVADFFQSIHPKDDSEATTITDALYFFIQNTPVPPEDFFAAFEKSRRLILSQLIEPSVFLDELQTCLSKGVPIEDVCKEIQAKHEIGA